MASIVVTPQVASVAGTDPKFVAQCSSFTSDEFSASVTKSAATRAKRGPRSLRRSSI